MIVARSKLPASGAIERFVDGVKAGMTADEEAGSFDYAVAVNRWSMKLLGLWPLDTRLSHFRCGVSLGLLMLLLFPAITYLFMIMDLMTITNQATMTLPTLPTLMRFVVMKTRAKNLRALLRSMSRDWASYRYLPARERRIMVHYAKRGRRINVVCIVWMLLAIGAFTLTPFGYTWLNSHPGNATARRLPMEFPFLLEQSYAYEMTYVAQSIIATIGCTAIISVDCFVCIVVFHACGQLDVLAATMERYDGTVEHDFTGKPRLRPCSCLPCIVKRHVHIMNYMDVVEKSFNNFILCQLLVATFMLALQDFQILLFVRHNNITGFIAFIIYEIAFTFYIFIYCYVGDCIIEKSENIGRTAYNLEWINFPRNYARPIILLIARSRRPCKITAGRFVPMNLSCYKRIITTSLSYMSVLMAIK